NLVAHKIGPALAAGNSVVLKPASTTPLCAVLLCQVLHDAGLPPGRLNLVTGSGASVGDWLLAEERVGMYTFTGSTEIGLQVKAKSGLRRCTLELGSNAANLVFADADVEQAADVLIRKGMQNAGQMCISVQRILVHRSVADRFLAAAAATAATLKVGDPDDPATDVGPLISEREATRAEEWVAEAVSQGAHLVCGGKRRGPVLEPTIVAQARADMKVVCQEVFAPVVTVMTFDTDDEALALANDSLYGLQAGIFTRDLYRALRFGRELTVGGVIVGDSSAFRADLMPYGGVKGSGIGREGPRYAIEEMTDQRLIVFNL
ncbi:MAG: aldehyde dehydrogenase family protein, partial [Firmicutes bacterium]|nr:aldehyde dehydrogenase family protein [Bacillota bacterium]